MSADAFPEELRDRYFPLGDPITEGGSSTVWKCWRDNEGAPLVAVKVISVSQLLNLAQAESHFYREVESLSRLNSKNIAILLDSGWQDSRYAFIVTEWVEQSLQDYLSKCELNDADVISRLIVPLMEALSYAHSQEVLHRDLKPSNIRINRDNDPIIIDFGIAKFRNSHDRPTVTVSNAGSPPYSPPDIERTSAPARDVYGLAALIITIFRRRIFRNYSEVLDAINELDHPAVKDVLNRAISMSEPGLRPDNVEILRDLLDHAFTVDDLIPISYLSLYASTRSFSPVQREEVRSAYEGISIEDAVTRDLSNGFHASIIRNSKDDANKVIEYAIIGTRFSYKIAFRSPGLASFEYAKDADEKSIEWLRERSPHINNFRVIFGRVDNETERLFAYADFEETVRSASEIIRLEKENQKLAKLFANWSKVLDAREQYQESKAATITYTERAISGRTITFLTSDNPGQSLMGLDLAVKVGPRKFFSGEVIDISDDAITLSMSNPRLALEEIASVGELKIDLNRSLGPIKKERDALNEVRDGSSSLVNPNLRQLIAKPETATCGEEDQIVEWFNKSLDVQKQDAVRSALAANDIFLLQGPPGTGKTTFIAETVGQVLKLNPRAKILIASQTHTAVDNALEKIQRILPGTKMCRLAGEGQDAKVSSITTNLLLTSQLEEWVQRTVTRSEEEFHRLCSVLGTNPNDVKQALLLTDVASRVSSLENLHAEIASLENDLQHAEDEAAQIEISGTLSELNDSSSKLSKSVKDSLISLESDIVSKYLLTNESTSERFKTVASELLPTTEMNAPRIRKLVGLLNDWHQRLERPMDFGDVVLHQSNVIGATCIGIARFQSLAHLKFDLVIIDEASKSLPTEAMVAMVRGKKWILVGDEKQLPPFIDESIREHSRAESLGIDSEQARTSLFARLVGELPTESKLMLTDQYRMTPGIGNLVSKCFYDGKLNSFGPGPYEGLSKSLTAPVLWLDTSDSDQRYESKEGRGTSYVNLHEVEIIGNFLSDLNAELMVATEEASVILLAPYAAQLNELNLLCEQESRNWPNLSISVSSVDAAQGRESDIVIFSITTSNRTNRIGFLVETPRVNVALSRARRGLVLVGDMSFWEVRTAIPLGKVAEYIKNEDGISTERRRLPYE